MQPAGNSPTSYKECCGQPKRQRPLKNSPEGAEAAFETTKILRNTWDNITLYNQTPQGALEILLRDLAALNARGGNIFKCAVM